MLKKALTWIMIIAVVIAINGFTIPYFASHNNISVMIMGILALGVVDIATVILLIQNAILVD